MRAARASPEAATGDDRPRRAAYASASSCQQPAPREQAPQPPQRDRERRIRRERVAGRRARPVRIAFRLPRAARPPAAARAPGRFRAAAAASRSNSARSARGIELGRLDDRLPHLDDVVNLDLALGGGRGARCGGDRATGAGRPVPGGRVSPVGRARGTLGGPVGGSAGGGCSASPVSSSSSISTSSSSSPSGPGAMPCGRRLIIATRGSSCLNGHGPVGKGMIPLREALSAESARSHRLPRRRPTDPSLFALSEGRRAAHAAGVTVFAIVMTDRHLDDKESPPVSAGPARTRCWRARAPAWARRPST